MKYLYITIVYASMALLMFSCQDDNDLCDLTSYDLPRFPGCEDLNPCEIEDCANKNLNMYIYSLLKYPSVARENGIEGVVQVKFFVETDGTLSDILIVKDIGGGCGEALKTVIESMNNMDEKWIPGSIDGVDVRMEYIIFVTFQLT